MRCILNGFLFSTISGGDIKYQSGVRRGQGGKGEEEEKGEKIGEIDFNPPCLTLPWPFMQVI